jgi:hypothetical protein
MTISEIKSQLRRGDIRAAEEISGIHKNTIGNYLHNRHRTMPDTELKILGAFTRIFEQRKAAKIEYMKRMLNLSNQ